MRRKSLDLAGCRTVARSCLQIDDAISTAYMRRSAGAPPGLALQRYRYLPIAPPQAAAPVPLYQEENRLAKVGHNLDFSQDPFFKGCRSLLMDRDKRDYILPVRNQGKTNSCYAFVMANVIAAAEGGLKGCHGSEQELLDRLLLYSHTRDEWRRVPEEGLPNNFQNCREYTQKIGLSFAAQYKWVGWYQPHPTTSLTSDQERIYVKDYKLIHENHKLAVEQLEIQPLAGAIIAGRSFNTWGFEDKIYEGPSEEEKEEARKKGILSPNHAVTLVGSGGEEGIDDYYLCQNSYGPNWGHHGYFKVRRRAVYLIFYPLNVYTARRNCTESNGADDAEPEDSDPMDID